MKGHDSSHAKHVIRIKLNICNLENVRKYVSGDLNQTGQWLIGICMIRIMVCE